MATKKQPKNFDSGIDYDKVKNRFNQLGLKMPFGKQEQEEDQMSEEEQQEYEQEQQYEPEENVRPMEKKRKIDEYFKNFEQQQAQQSAQFKRVPESEVELMQPVLVPEGSTNTHIEKFRINRNEESLRYKSIPFKEKLSTNLTTANYNEREKIIAFELSSIAETQQFISEQYGVVDLSASADYHVNLMNMMSAITKGYQMSALKMMKTTRQEGIVEETSIQKDQTKKKWGFF